MTDQTADASTFDEWCVIELMGHRRLAGHLREQEIAGEGFLRLDVFPGDAAEPIATQFYRPGAVYCITPTTERIAREVARGTDPGPVKRWELAELEAPKADPDNEDEDEDEDDDLDADLDAIEGTATHLGPYGSVGPF